MVTYTDVDRHWLKMMQTMVLSYGGRCLRKMRAVPSKWRSEVCPNFTHFLSALGLRTCSTGLASGKW